MELAKDESIFLVPMAKRRYAQFKFRPDYRIEELLKEYKIPYRKKSKPFKKVKLVDAEHTQLNDYKVERKDGKAPYYSFSFASDIIDKILDYYEVSYTKNYYRKVNDIEKETNKVNYKTKQANAKLETWYICNKLGIKYNTWVSVRKGERSLAKDKLDQFLELTDTNRKEYLVQESEKRKIDQWYEYNPNILDKLLTEFKVTAKTVGEEIGADSSNISNIKVGKGNTSQIKYLLYYYFMDEGNKRMKEEPRKYKKQKKEKEEPMKEIKYEDITPLKVAPSPLFISNGTNKTADETANEDNTIVMQPVSDEFMKNAFNNTDILHAKLNVLEKENRRLAEDLERYKYLIDLAINANKSK